MLLAVEEGVPLQNGMYLSVAGASAAGTRMDVISNNLANMSTTGFRRGYAVFQKRLAEAIEPPRFEPSWDRVLDDLGGGLDREFWRADGGRRRGIFGLGHVASSAMWAAG